MGNTIRLKLETLSCPTCIEKIRLAIRTIKGVEGVEVYFNSSTAIVQGDVNVEEVVNVVTRLGYEVLDVYR